jgi:alkanesulfonate monooxygenase SsuD/methylene tetrahydromethanopterin reductase-like flavin-dependent oxidoreductase (luciferase family)
VPLPIGKDGDRMLRLSAEHADIAAFTGARTVPGSTTGQLTPITAAELDERVARYLKFTADHREEPPELNLLLQMVIGTGDREAAAQPFLEPVPDMTVDQVLELPVSLVGTPDEPTEQVLARRGRYGLTYLTVLEPSVEAFAPVMERVRGA